MPTLDATAAARQHIVTILKAILNSVDEKVRRQSPNESPRLLRDWDKEAGSTHFQIPRTDRVQADDLHEDLAFIYRAAVDAGAAKIVICIDEGQRIDAFALSALKNALQSLDGYLVILSLRIVDDKVGAEEAGRSILDKKAQEAEGDFGASRFLVGGVPLGPFTTDQEARACLLRRLDGNTITFNEEVISLIGRITERHPSAIIALASHVYEVTADANLEAAAGEVLRRAFQQRYRNQYAEALSIRGQLSEGARQNLRALIEIGRPADADELADQMYPEVSPAARKALAAGIKGDLDRICKSSFCAKKDDRYEISNPMLWYALQLALESQ